MQTLGLSFKNSGSIKKLPLLSRSKLSLGFILPLLAACGTINPQAQLDQKPRFDLKGYFDGPIVGYGIVQDRSGTVISRFDVKMQGSWQGTEGRLDEVFNYYDDPMGQPPTRTWYFKQKPDGQFEGRASDIEGLAVSSSYGAVGRWQYSMKLPVGKNKILVRFDDWMWPMNDGVIINRSYIKKYGFKVAEVTIVMQKRNP
jgi:hypothetical protein